MTTLPAGWRLVRLDEVADSALGKMLDKGVVRGHGHVPYLRNVNVQWGRVELDSVFTMELADDERERFAVEDGDLLVCEGGEIGRAAIWRGRGEYMAYQKALHRIRGRGLVEPAYLRYLFEHYAKNGTLERYSTGSTIAHLPQQRLKTLPVPLAPVGEQRRIVDMLEDHLSRLDAADATLALASRRLVALEAAALAGARSGEPRDLGAVADIQGGIQKQQKRAPKINAYPFLRVANVTASGLDLREVHSIELFGDELERLRLTAGDLLVVEGNGSPAQIGRAALWDGSIPDCVHQNHLIRVRPLQELMPDYLEAVWNSPENRRSLTQLASSSSGLHTLSVGKLKALQIPVPDLDAQRSAMGAVNRVREARRELDRQLRVARRRGAGLRRALLAAAFSGRLTGRASDMDRVEELAAAGAPA